MIRINAVSLRRAVPWGTLALYPPSGSVAEGTTAVPTVSGIAVLGQVSLSLILVVAVLLLLAWALRRINRLQPHGAVRLRLLGGLSLGGRERILLVEADDRRLLIGVSPGGLRTLLVLDADARADARAVPHGPAGAPLAPPRGAG
jgi:flagellar protein FliO/FliZ